MSRRYRFNKLLAVVAVLTTCETTAHSQHLVLDLAAAECPGFVAISLNGAGPDAKVRLIGSEHTGTTIITEGECAGVTIGLDNATFSTGIDVDSSGEYLGIERVNQNRCGMNYQAVDLVTCAVSEVQKVRPVDSENTIPPEGGDVSLENVVTVKFEPGSFETPQTASIKLERSPLIRELFSDVDLVYSSPERLAYELVVEIEDQQPSKNVSVLLHVPTKYLRNLEGSRSAGAFFREVYVSDIELHDHFELMALDLITDENFVGFPLAPSAFYVDSRSGHFRATVVLGSILSQEDVGYSSLTESGCLQSSLCQPFLGVGIPSSPFGPRTRNGKLGFHRGVDYPIPQGTPVLAMRGGTVHKIAKQLDHNGTMKGWGQLITIRHDDTCRTLYAHLQEDSAAVSVGETVVAGQTLALSGNTGTSSGPHLHIEYICDPSVTLANGSRGRIDPFPCVVPNLQCSNFEGSLVREDGELFSFFGNVNLNCNQLVSGGINGIDEDLGIFILSTSIFQEVITGNEIEYKLCNELGAGCFGVPSGQGIMQLSPSSISGAFTYFSLDYTFTGACPD